MGSGKTSWAISYVNEHPDENVLYITPYLEEDERICNNVQRKMRMPSFREGRKFDDLLNLLDCQEDIASTHALFMKLDNDCKAIIQRGNYTLFLDETINAVEPFNVKYKDDIQFLLDKKSIKIDDNGFIEWIDVDYDTRYNHIKILAQNHCLFYVNKKLLMWRYPPDIFRLFKRIYILTYLFPASILKYYFQLNDIKYETKSIQEIDGKYNLCDYYKPDTSQYKDKIHIYDGRDLNDNFYQKDSSLSATWLRSARHTDEINIIKKNIYNFFSNKVRARAANIMWTTFKDCQNKLRGKGYATCFVAHNCRATNDYVNAKYLCYALNKYPDPGTEQFFLQHGITIDRDLYALSELLQWIWRSNIRDDGEIWIYLPSNRMRKLLKDWLKNECR